VSIWWRGREPAAEKRDSTMSLNQLLAKLKTGSYAEVDLSTAESSLQAVAVFASTDLIASLCSELPVDVFRGSGPDRTQLSMPWWLEDPDGSGHGLPDWCYRACMSWLLRGNLYGEELQRSSSGFLQQVELFHPDTVSGSIVGGDVRWLVSGRPVTNQDRFVHRRVNPMAGMVLGLSPIQLLASTIGLQLTAGKFGLQWFQDGGHPSALLTNTEVNLDEDQARTVKNIFMAAMRGTREPVVFGKGWDYKQIQVNAEESQFLQTQGYSAAECARIFGPGIAEILGYGSGSMTYSNIVDRDISLLKYSVGRWLRRMERVLSQFLPRPQYVKFNRDALLETNTMQRYLAHASALTNQWKVVNEVRAVEELAPVPWGDKPNMTTAAAPAAAAEDPTPPADPGAQQGE
jgi:HK97 family phage portal protein